MALRLLLDHLAYAEHHDQEWARALRTLESRGVFNSLGVTGALSTVLPVPGQDAVASIYAELAHDHGWLQPDTTLTAEEHASLRRRLLCWAAQDRPLTDVLEPSAWEEEHSRTLSPSRRKEADSARPDLWWPAERAAFDEGIDAGCMLGSASESSPGERCSALGMRWPVKARRAGTTVPTAALRFIGLNVGFGHMWADPLLSRPAAGGFRPAHRDSEVAIKSPLNSTGG
ncbi:hypothetical protein ACBJ59_52175 [Nonomuraea sp. MTCD27]|uniref:hypothetical protein n=1 Tax=Nonomuraea sp. MTCD27 TaxID=1676747 RepID=UPI0035C0F1D4